MLTLALLRHAKSNWGDPGEEDFERSLAKRGVKAAPEIGAYLAKHDLKPDLVLCSSAVRTRATLALVLPELGRPPPEVLTEDALYLASPIDLLDRLHALGRIDGPAPKRVMILGHNPGLHSLALSLSGRGPKDLIGGLAQKFPTAALAVLTFEAASWSDIAPASGRLTHFVTPRALG